jgi:hypothetical protein
LGGVRGRFLSSQPVEIEDDPGRGLMKELWEKHKGTIGLALLIVYTLGLGVAVADEIFHLGLFPPKLDKLIAKAIDDFASPEVKVRDQAFNDIVEYGEFAIPLLIKSLDGDPSVRDASIKALQKITEQKFAEPGQWEEWYAEHKSDFM